MCKRKKKVQRNIRQIQMNKSRNQTFKIRQSRLKGKNA